MTASADTSRIGGINVAQFLEGWWDAQARGGSEYKQDGELQAMLAPFGVRFPGLAPTIDEPLGAELMRRALRQYTRDARIGLVPASRMGLRGVSEIAPALVGNPFWDFWWD